MSRWLLNQQTHSSVASSTAAFLHPNSSANQFEQSLADFGRLIGIAAERHDFHGQGPDVLWLLPDRIGLVIEAKSRKKSTASVLNKEEHGQLLVAKEWFAENYPEHACVGVAVYPTNKATKAAAATGSYALTYENLASMVADARTLLTTLCYSQLSNTDLRDQCARELGRSRLKAEHMVANYLVQFVEQLRQ